MQVLIILSSAFFLAVGLTFPKVPIHSLPNQSNHLFFSHLVPKVLVSNGSSSIKHSYRFNIDTAFSTDPSVLTSKGTVLNGVQQTNAKQPFHGIGLLEYFGRGKRQLGYPTAPSALAPPSTCGCYSHVLCPPVYNDGSTLIDFRIVNGGIPTCTTGLQYCCPSGNNNVYQSSYTCGTRFAPTISYPLLSGQARYGDYPWMVAILTSDNQYVGGGVLIDSQHVLTTAHRITQYPNGNGLKIRLGEWDISSNYEQYPYREYNVVRLWLHELFNPSSLQNDIALIRLSGQVPFTQPIGVVPVCLPSVGQSFEGQRCWVSGWGSDIFGTNGRYQNILKTVDLPIFSSMYCENILRTTRLNTDFTFDKDSFICAGGEANKDACTGDGGSGLVCETTPGRWVLAGLVSWGLGCATPGIPGTYVNVENFMPWIQARQDSI